jgi:hypothetical protein
LSEQGIADPARFYESPHSGLTDQGISGVRGMSELDTSYLWIVREG